jgi:hypothetical protein
MSAAHPTAAGGGPQPKPYQPAAVDAAAEPREAAASAPEHASSGDGAASEAQAGTGGNAAPSQPAARKFTRDQLQEMSQAAHGVQQQMSELLTQRKPGATCALVMSAVACPWVHMTGAMQSSYAGACAAVRLRSE